jgi:hypothetical protein
MIFVVVHSFITKTLDSQRKQIEKSERQEQHDTDEEIEHEMAAAKVHLANEFEEKANARKVCTISLYRWSRLLTTCTFFRARASNAHLRMMKALTSPTLARWMSKKTMQLLLRVRPPKLQLPRKPPQVEERRIS